MINVYLSEEVEVSPKDVYIHPGFTTRLASVYINDPSGVNLKSLPVYRSESEALAAGLDLNDLFVDYSGQTKLVMQRTSFIMNFSARRSLLRRVF